MGQNPLLLPAYTVRPQTGAPAFEMLPLIAIPWPGCACPATLMLTAN